MDFFKNEAETRIIHDLNIENRLDRVALFGSLDITHDAAGLALAQELKTLLDGIVTVLSDEQTKGELPAQITVAAAEEVDNPFL